MFRTKPSLRLCIIPSYLPSVCCRSCSDGEISDVRKTSPSHLRLPKHSAAFHFLIDLQQQTGSLERMSGGYLLLLVAAIFVAWGDGFANAQLVNHLEVKTNLVDNVDAHRGLQDNKKITKAEIKATLKERMADPDVRLAAGELRSMLRKNPELAQAFKKNQVVEDRGFNLQNPAVVKELKFVGGIAVFAIGTYLLARIIGQHT
ncbi:hypothetical protein ON010_g7897 [Phytophthora cinnamomi]|nr:hypothetical protein ON010_g7897 [Phytophthora cinnamomi]